GCGDEIAVPLLTKSPAILHEYRDRILRVVGWGKTCEPESVGVTLSVLRCTGLTGHADAVYSCITRGPVLDAVHHHLHHGVRRLLADRTAEFRGLELLQRSEVGSRDRVDEVGVHDDPAVGD